MILSPTDPSRRLICFLGKNKYGAVRYRFGGEDNDRVSSVTPWVSRAIGEIVGHPSEIFVVATREAWKFTPNGETQSNSERLARSFKEAGFPKPIYKRIEQGSIWDQFNILKDLIRAPAAEVMLDISYGFRSIPFFAAAVTAFIRAIEKNPPNIRIFYGAYDDRKDDIAPLLEFTEFIALLDWTQALRMFLHTGRAEEAVMLTTKPALDSEPLHELSEAMKAFSLDLQTLRTGNLLIERDGQQSSAKRLSRAVEAARSDARSYLPPLAGVLNELVKTVEPLTSDIQNLSGDDGHKAVSALAHLYLSVGRYLEAAVTIREGGINKCASDEALRPGASDFNKNHRDKAEKRAGKNNTNSETQEIKAIRNDMSHAQYVKNPKSASEIISGVDCAVKAFSKVS